MGAEEEEPKRVDAASASETTAAAEEYLLPLRTPCAYYVPRFLAEADADDGTSPPFASISVASVHHTLRCLAYRDLLAHTPWEKTAKINRWVALRELPRDAGGGGGGDGGGGDGEDAAAAAAAGRGYRYRDAPGAALVGFPPVLMQLKRRAEAWLEARDGPPGSAAAAAAGPVEFNVCLLNYYEDGDQRIGWVRRLPPRPSRRSMPVLTHAPAPTLLSPPGGRGPFPFPVLFFRSTPTARSWGGPRPSPPSPWGPRGGSSSAARRTARGTARPSPWSTGASW